METSTEYFFAYSCLSISWSMIFSSFDISCNITFSENQIFLDTKQNCSGKFSLLWNLKSKMFCTIQKPIKNKIKV